MKLLGVIVVAAVVINDVRVVVEIRAVTVGAHWWRCDGNSCCAITTAGHRLIA